MSYEESDHAEKIYLIRLHHSFLDFCMKVSGVKKSVTSMMVCFKQGCKPLQWSRTYRMLKYWLRLENCEILYFKQNKQVHRYVKHVNQM